MVYGFPWHFQPIAYNLPFLLVKPKLHIINTWHRGDALLTRPIISSLKPQFELTLECTQQAAYLWADLGLPIFPGNPDNPTHDSPLRPPDAAGVNLWFGTYPDLLYTHGMTIVNQAHTFNRRMRELGLPWNFSIPTAPPPVDFAPVPLEIDIKPRSILVENGPAQSNQSTFELNPCLPQLFAEFPGIHFYCASPPPVSAPNASDLSHLNLIQLSQVGDKCAAFVTRGSGISAACYTRASMWKPRCILGWTYGMLIWHNRVEYLENYAQLVEFVRRAVPQLAPQFVTPFATHVAIGNATERLSTLAF
jgi:hypothetical protein